MQRPWVYHYDPSMTPHIAYPHKTLYEMLKRTAEHFPRATALRFEGTRIRYGDLQRRVDRIAFALEDLGFTQGDVVTICMPNTPHAVIFFYALNRIGAIAQMVHPKTPAGELKEHLRSCESKALLVSDLFLAEHVTMLAAIDLPHVFVARIGDYLKLPKRIAFFFAKGRTIQSVPKEKRYRLWRKLATFARNAERARQKTPGRFVYKQMISPHAPAVYLPSGGTTGSPKTVVLSSHNFNVLAVQGPQIVNIDDPFESGVLPEVSMVTILPLFHGFGLCMGLHAMMANGITAILVPLFTPDRLAKAIVSEKANFLAAVPTLFEGLMKSKWLDGKDLSYLRACFCGGDALSPDLKRRFEAFLKEHNSSISLREGYGLTEVVTVCCVNPEVAAKAGSIGLPLPDIDMKIVDLISRRELAAGEKGEICVAGPTVMLGYLGDKKATDETLVLDDDGRTWVHTGDVGYRDEAGYFYFVQRIKRIIKVSGVPVFPTQIERVISDVSGVELCCVVAKPDAYRGHVPKAYVVADTSYAADALPDLRAAIVAACREHLLPYARPVDIVFRQELKKTKVGKIDHVNLEAEESH